MRRAWRFNAWRKLGRFVKKGEKGIAIIAPMILQHKAEPAPVDDSQDSMSRSKRRMCS